MDIGCDNYIESGKIRLPRNRSRPWRKRMTILGMPQSSSVDGFPARIGYAVLVLALRVLFRLREKGSFAFGPCNRMYRHKTSTTT